MPAASALNLQIISPTTGFKEEKITWMSEFLVYCYEMRNDVQPCDINTIAKWSVHDFKCQANQWEENYGGPDANFQAGLLKLMNELLPDAIDWYDFINSRKLWVTATSCNWDPNAYKQTKKDQPPTNEESCMRITGQTEGLWGKGSIAYLRDNDLFERIFWFTTWGQNKIKRGKTDNSMLVNTDGTLNPCGRAFVNNLDPRLSNCLGTTQDL